MKNLKTLSLMMLLFLSSVASANSRFPFGYKMELLNHTFSNWGITNTNSSSINLSGAWKNFEKKKDVVIAVIDTGIDYNHPHLRDNIHVINGKVSESNYGVDFSMSKPSLTPADSHGHGTHVAGIIKSVFPEAKLLILKYYNPQASGQANLNSTIRALEFAVDQTVDMINYSGGGPEPSLEELRILRKAEEKGILVVAAAGNEKSNIDDKKYAYYPASYGLDNIISVNAHDEDVNVIASSNWGKLSVDVAAPGLRIISSIPGGKAAAMTGTSQATAFVTGVAALIKANYPELSYEQIKNSIIASSVKVKSLEDKTLAGGKVDATMALAMAARVNELSKEEKKGRALAKKK
ncbi:MAG: S8 family serine peptidase [Bacteriovoracaceae bacterium]|nr:S8 family serine peptidase [Bacteriovoracaceae bacterium]